MPMFPGFMPGVPNLMDLPFSVAMNAGMPNINVPPPNFGSPPMPWMPNFMQYQANQMGQFSNTAMSPGFPQTSFQQVPGMPSPMFPNQTMGITAASNLANVPNYTMPNTTVTTSPTPPTPVTIEQIKAQEKLEEEKKKEKEEKEKEKKKEVEHLTMESLLKTFIPSPAKEPPKTDPRKDRSREKRTGERTPTDNKPTVDSHTNKNLSAVFEGEPAQSLDDKVVVGKPELSEDSLLADQPVKKYHFAWDDMEEEDDKMSHLSVSTIHTSDLSSFEDEYTDSEEGPTEEESMDVDQSEQGDI